MARAPKILGLRIERFRAITERIELAFTTPVGAPADVVVLAGPNGSGKTSMLEAILLALGQEDLIAGSADPERAWRRAVPRDASIEIDVSFDGGKPEVWSPGHAHGAKLAGDDLAMEIEYFSSWRAPQLVGAIKPLAGPGGRPQDTESNRLWRLKQRINDEKARVAFKNGGGKKSKADDWLARINRAWQLLHHDDSRIDAQLVDPDAEDVRADLYLLRGDTRVCSVDQLSAGEVELITIAGAVVLNELAHGVVLIDEPELHLHSEWQAGILPALRELAPGVQFIVATHSDTVWDRSPGYARFNLMPRPPTEASGEDHAPHR